jgi:hypothetical protein
MHHVYYLLRLVKMFMDFFLMILGFENFMDMLQYVFNQNVQEAVKKFQDTKNKRI